MAGGYIKLYRKIREHWVWEESIYLKWWLDILLMVNHQTAKILINGQIKIIEAGEIHTSETKLAKRWYADRKTVDKFLKLLEKDGMISIEKSRKNGTTVKVLNYKDYQAFLEPSMDNKMNNGMDKTLDITFPKESHKQEPKEPEEPKEVKNKDMSLVGLRQRYTSEQLKVIDDFFDVLKHTRKSARLADSVIAQIYQAWNKHESVKVIYALHKYIHTPSLHDKKENYVLGIIRNTTMADIEKYKKQVGDTNCQDKGVYGGEYGGDKDGDSL